MGKKCMWSLCAYVFISCHNQKIIDLASCLNHATNILLILILRWTLLINVCDCVFAKKEIAISVLDNML